MYFVVSFVAALTGVAFAAAAAFLPDTGVDGTLGALLALLGAAGLLLIVGLLAVWRVSTAARWTLVGIAALTSALTALAGWFLMQDEIAVAAVVSLLALMAASAIADQKTIA